MTILDLVQDRLPGISWVVRYGPGRLTISCGALFVEKRWPDPTGVLGYPEETVLEACDELLRLLFPVPDGTSTLPAHTTNLLT